jgi:hypothetical protein
VTGLTETDLELIWVNVRAGPFSLLLSTIRSVVDEAGEAGANVELIGGPLIQIVFGAPLRVRNADGARRRLVRQLQEDHGDFVSILHGSRRWPVGSYGGTDRLTYGVLSHEMDDWYRRLFSLKPGEVVELAESATTRSHNV